MRTAALSVEAVSISGCAVETSFEDGAPVRVSEAIYTRLACQLGGNSCSSGPSSANMCAIMMGRRAGRAVLGQIHRYTIVMIKQRRLEHRLRTQLEKRVSNWI